jgi:hypothetical protein
MSPSSLPPDWSLRLGDIANNFRASLDHLAWTITERGATPPATLSEGGQKGVGFPIAPNNSTFNRVIRTRLPGVRRADIAKVRRFQPYVRGQRKRPFQCLSILAWFNNLDKHRTIQPVRGLPTEGAYEIANVKDCIVHSERIRAYSEPLEVDAEVGLVRVKKTGPDPDMDVKLDLTGQITLDNRVTVADWLNQTRRWIFALLQSFDDPPDWDA